MSSVFDRTDSVAAAVGANHICILSMTTVAPAILVGPDYSTGFVWQVCCCCCYSRMIVKFRFWKVLKLKLREKKLVDFSGIDLVMFKFSRISLSYRLEKIM